MRIGEVDIEVINKVIRALATGLKKVECETPDGRRVTGYWITDKQIRVDLIDKG